MGNIYTIAANQSFFDNLVAGIDKRFGSDNPNFSDIIVLVPSRRAVKELRASFLRYFQGKALLLPNIHAIGDIDEEEISLNILLDSNNLLEIPPPVTSVEQQILLSNLILEHHKHKSITIEQAIDLARDLAAFLAELQREEIDILKLNNLVAEEVAIHWQQIMEFLNLITIHWPNILKEKNKIDPVNYRNQLVKNQQLVWQKNPPNKTIIAAGSTGTIKSTSNLLKAILDLPKGIVILPAVDIMIDEASWHKIDEFHPQYNIKKILKYFNVNRCQLQAWHEDYFFCNNNRLKLLSEALRCANSSEQWNDLFAIEEEAFSNLNLVVCDNLQYEAQTIALIIRHYLHNPKQTIALVTNERALAQRVISILTRYDIDIDDSAGIELSITPPMAYLRLIASMIESNFTPISMLSALKHPLASGGLKVEAFRNLIREIELLVMRGVRIKPGFQGIIYSLKKLNKKDLADYLLTLFPKNSNFIKLMSLQKANFKEILLSHLSFAEALAGNEQQSGDQLLWQGDIGLSCVEFIRQLIESCGDLNLIPTKSYTKLFDNFLVGKVYRPRYGRHPRVTILSPTESRFFYHDVIIMGALNEGNWPENVKTGPWISRTMRHNLGLPSLERKIGQLAFDFYYLSCAKEVYYTRSLKVDGAETVPSRFLLRLTTLLKKFGKDLSNQSKWQNYIRLLNQPSLVQGYSAPSAKPDIKYRPKKLSVTDIEKLMRDPYSIYAKHILKLKKLDVIDADPGAADFGNFVHKSLEYFSLHLKDSCTKDMWYNSLIEAGYKILSGLLDRPAIYALWWTRYERIAKWIAINEQTIDINKSIYIETTGKMIFNFANKDFTLTAKADRMEIDPLGDIFIIDYKTGTVPSLKNVIKGISPQMILEALIASNNGFVNQDKFNAYKVTKLNYIYLSGGKVPAEEIELKVDIEKLVEQAKDGLQRLILAFMDKEVSYLASPLSDRVLRYNNYEHLARNKEWIE
jgi:ATP-dependent helicase/nuclease subunit B